MDLKGITTWRPMSHRQTTSCFSRAAWAAPTTSRAATNSWRRRHLCSPPRASRRRSRRMGYYQGMPRRTLSTALTTGYTSPTAAWTCIYSTRSLLVVTYSSGGGRCLSEYCSIQPCAHFHVCLYCNVSSRLVVCIIPPREISSWNEESADRQAQTLACLVPTRLRVLETITNSAVFELLLLDPELSTGFLSEN